MQSKLSLCITFVFLCASPVASHVVHAEDRRSAVELGVDAYNHGQIATALRILSGEAKRGDSDAQVNLGYMYARGEGVAQNQAEAFRLYLLSAKQGNGEGMNAVGYKYQYGTGVPPDIAKAVYWYCMAVERGNPRAMNNLALLYENGLGVPRDIDEARDLWRQAAERGHTNGMYKLARSFLSGSDGTVDTQQGVTWLKRAAQNGQPLAQQMLRRMGYRDAMPPPINEAKAMRLQPKDIAPGHARACGSVIS
jgi:TPR repeat protein